MPQSCSVDNTRNFILQYAATSLLQDGYDKFSIPAIAKKAGTTPRTIYDYFGPRDSLINEAVKALIQQTQEQIQQFVESEDYLSASGYEQAILLLKFSLQYAIDCPEYIVHVSHTEQTLHEKRHTDDYQVYLSYSTVIRDYLNAAICKGKEDGSIKPSSYTSDIDYRSTLLALQSQQYEFAYISSFPELKQQYAAPETLNDLCHRIIFTSDVK